MKKLISIYKGSALEEKLLWLYTAFMPIINIFYLKIDNKKIICADIIFIILFVVWVTKCINGKTKFNKSCLLLPLLLMPVLFLPSLVNSVNMLNSLSELTGLIYLAILFVLIGNIVSDSEKLRPVLYVYLVTAAIISLLGLADLLTAYIFGNMHNSLFLGYGTMEAMAHHFARLKLTFDSPNMTLAYLHTALIMGIILFIAAKRKGRKIFILLAVMIIFAAAFFAGSRRFAGFLLSVFMILCWFGRGKIASLCKYLFFSGFLLVFAAAFITSIWVVFPVKIIKDDTSKTVHFEAKYAYSIHYLLPSVAMNMFKKHPFVGVGYGTFNRNFKGNVDWEWLKSSYGFEAYPSYPKLVEDKTLNFDPHSVVFGMLAETGIIGFMGLIYFLSSYVIMLLRKFKDAAYFTFERAIFGCLLAGVIGFLLNALTLDILSMRHFWFMLAIGFAGIHQESLLWGKR